MARPSKTTDNVAVVEVEGKTRRAVIRWSGDRFALLLSNHGRYNRILDSGFSVGVLLKFYNGRLLQN